MISKLCAGCLHPIFMGDHCPFCGSDETTKRCEDCGNAMTPLPSSFKNHKNYICYTCTLKEIDERTASKS